VPELWFVDSIKRYALSVTSLSFSLIRDILVRNITEFMADFGEMIQNDYGRDATQKLLRPEFGHHGILKPLFG
jgi:hypothetical protein